jgi:hypothetical protein
MSASSLPLRFDSQVLPGGRIEVSVPLPPGSQVTIYVTQTPNAELNDVLQASISSTEFWDNPYDDEDWNDA